MMNREVDRQRWRKGMTQLAGGHNTMISIHPDPLRRIDSHQNQKGGNRATDQPEPCVSFPHVMNERGANHIRVGDPIGDHRQGGVVAMPLIVVRLLEEDLGQLRAEPVFHCRAFRAVQRR